MGKTRRLAATFGIVAAAFVASSGILPAIASAADHSTLTAQEKVFVDYLQAHGDQLTDENLRSAAIDVGYADCKAFENGVTKADLVDQLPGGQNEKDEASLVADAAVAAGSLCG
ncbi:DUF732 domain-containing protein [Nocardia sp. NPDC088792]|uniref:DUF732 domain-containing protein n=1 Tax=Nocardia sp. NPDC088792 TaxID=3364332 RepID=UPI0037F9C011